MTKAYNLGSLTAPDGTLTTADDGFGYMGMPQRNNP